MKIATYPFVKRPESYYYEFYSEGPNGSIKKVVEYFRLQELDAEVFNLAFGDWDEDNHRINDLSISNNADRDKVLATVAATVTDFRKIIQTRLSLQRAAPRLDQVIPNGHC